MTTDAINKHLPALIEGIKKRDQEPPPNLDDILAPPGHILVEVREPGQHSRGNRFPLATDHVPNVGDRIRLNALMDHEWEVIPIVVYEIIHLVGDGRMIPCIVCRTDGAPGQDSSGNK